MCCVLCDCNNNIITTGQCEVGSKENKEGGREVRGWQAPKWIQYMYILKKKKKREEDSSIYV